jgi:hypothetical protein
MQSNRIYNCNNAYGPIYIYSAALLSPLKLSGSSGCKLSSCIKRLSDFHTHRARAGKPNTFLTEYAQSSLVHL